ncbi:hypothetical protein ERX37_08875 [Macrococcus hajekii]|uniref:Uncharacterized protein n=1 Tax=Macrococcus hajekii TaxID=198482 RepID=A0A4R6BJ12_9STAP|nr:hypothetical protein [Macrococcus hajekii]TDM01597.1 hypothetical protein ERX37_08875 [Macrococcus hajekii]GGB01342.1 hypothetical protein GCM10007190_06760 [Macrococcus hajekii]
MLITLSVVINSVLRAAYADMTTSTADNENIIKLLETSHNNSEINWQLDINKLSNNLSKDVVTLKLQGAHQIDLPALNAAFKEQRIEVSQPDGSQSIYRLKINGLTQAYTVNLKTYIIDQSSNYRLTAETTSSEAPIQSSDVVYQLKEVTGQLDYQKVPVDVTAPDTIIYLVNTLTNEMVQKQSVPSTATTYIFNYVRTYDNNGRAID